MCFFKKKIGKPNPLVKITHTDIFTALKSEFGEDCVIFLSDKDYWTTSIDELKRFARS